VKSSFAWGAATAFAAVIGAPNAVRAEGRQALDLVWERNQGAEACPVKEDFAASVKSRVGGDPFQEGSARQLQVRLSRTPEKWRAEVRVLEAGSVKGSQQIETEGADCSGLFSAVVAVAAVMLDAQPKQPVASESIALEESKKSPARQPPAAAPSPAPALSAEPSRSDRQPAEGIEETSDQHWSLGIEVAQDLHFMPEKEGVCSQDSSYDCLEQDGTEFRGNAQPGTNNRVATGLRFGGPRVFLNAQTLLPARFGLELRVGWAFGARDLEDFRRWHVELGGRYWLASPSSRFRGYVGTGIGLAEFASRIPLTVSDCGPDPTVDEAVECLQRRRFGTVKKLSAYQRLGGFFLPVRIGAAWDIAGPHALIFGLAGNVTFPSRGLVIEPSAGYSAAF
jgi:hypothetical protein